jgi:uncharacterized protein
MAISLYDATVPTFCQLLGSVSAWLDRAEIHCRDKSIAPSEIIGACLATDMFPFAYQVKSTAVHSLGAIEGVRKGVFSPDTEPPPTDFGSLKARVSNTFTALQSIERSEVNSFVGRDMRFEFRDTRIPFTAEDFLLSFSLPNFFFHSTTAYDILRWKGLNIGKRDFLGKMRIKM